jgi:hypothetical protein
MSEIEEVSLEIEEVSKRASSLKIQRNFMEISTSDVIGLISGVEISEEFSLDLFLDRFFDFFLVSI